MSSPYLTVTAVIAGDLARAMMSLMPYRLSTVVLVALLLAAFAGCGGGSGSNPPAAAAPSIPAGGVLSITPNTSNIPPQSGPEILAAIQSTYDAGARGSYAAYRWSELEPQPGQFEVADVVSERPRRG